MTALGKKMLMAYNDVDYNVVNDYNYYISYILDEKIEVHIV